MCVSFDTLSSIVVRCFFFHCCRFLFTNNDNVVLLGVGS